MPNHCRAGTRGHDYRPRLGKEVQLPAGYCTRFVRITAGVRRLPTAGLVDGEVYGDAFTLKQTHRIEPGFRRKLVNQTRRK